MRVGDDRDGAWCGFEWYVRRNFDIPCLAGQ
jgi:hypothetical protein